MSDQPQLPRGDFNLPPGVSLNDVDPIRPDADDPFPEDFFEPLPYSQQLALTHWAITLCMYVCIAAVLLGGIAVLAAAFYL